MNDLVNNRLARLAMLSSIFLLGQEGLTYDSIQTQSTSVIDRLKQDPQHGKRFKRFEEIVQKGTLLFDDAGDEVEGSSFGLADLLATAISKGVERNPNLGMDDIDTALISVGKLLDSPQMKLYMDSVQGIKGVEILTTAVLVQMTSILSSSLPFDGAIGDMDKITTGNGRGQLAVYSLTPTALKGMGDIAKGDVLTPINTLQPFAYSTREKEFVISATLVYTLDLKQKKADATNAKMERGVNEVVIEGVDYAFNDFNENPTATDPSSTYTDANSKTIKVEWKYADGQIVVTFSDATDYVGKIISLQGGLDTSILSDITGEVGNTLAMKVYPSRVVRLATQINLMSIREVISSLKTNLLSENLKTLDMVLDQEATGRKIENALRFSTKSKKVADLDITAVGGATGGYAEQNKAFIVAVNRVVSEIRTTSQLAVGACVMGGDELENMFYRLDVASGGKTRQNQSIKENSVRILGTVNKITYIHYPLYDTKYPVAGGYSRATVIGIPTDIAYRVSQTGVDLPLIPLEISVDKNGDQYIPFEGKLISSSNKHLASQKLTKHFLFKQ